MLECFAFNDGDLPIQDCTGYYSRIVFYDNNFTQIGSGSFPGMETQTLMINSNKYLETIQQDFWKGREALVTSLQVNGNENLK